MRRRSLTRRLLVLLVLVQAGVPVLGMAAFMLLSPYVTWTDVAATSARDHIAAVLVPDPAAAGHRRLVPGATLRAYADSRPGFAFAVLIDDQVLPGSDPALSAALAHLAPFLPAIGRLELALPGAGATALFDTQRDGDARVTIVTVGDAFHADDLPAFASTYLPALLPILGPSLLVALIAVPLVVRRAMRPLRAAAREAGAIAFAAPTRRLSDADVPAEVLPLVEAINAALARLAHGAERQRLFHANAAHELRTPVAILQARLDAMPALPRGHELRRDARRIALLVEQLLAVERLGACGAGEAAIDLVPRMRALVADVAPLAIRSGRTLAFFAARAEPGGLGTVVRGNGQSLDSAVANLIDNAIRAEPPGGCVEVRVGPGPSVAVIDHGPGVAPQDRPLVFEPFWRKDERPPGAGLGLSIVREVARLHGGEVSVHTTQGGGATFRLDLPPHPAARTAPTIAAQAEAPVRAA